MTLPPGSDQPRWPAAAAGPRHAAQSPSGGYVPPPASGDEPATTWLPRLGHDHQPPGHPERHEPGGGPAGDPFTSGHPEPDRLAGDHPSGGPPGDPSGDRFGGLPGDPSGDPRGGPPDGGHAAAGPPGGGDQVIDQPAAGHLPGDLFADDPRPAGQPAAGHLPGDLFADDPRPAGQPAAGQPAVGRPRTEERPHGRHSADRPSALRLVSIYPDLLSTYGDRGNLIMLARRAGLRGIDVEAVSVNSNQPVPRQGDIYLLGGGEDLSQVLAARRLRADGGLPDAAARGAVVLAVCAGYQVVGSVFGGAQGEPVEGLGILDISSGRGERRGVGEILADVDPALGLDRLTGFENHQGVTHPGPGVRPLARTLVGVGNGDGTEGAYSGRILGTYLHGPALVRNPGLADLLLTWAVGSPLRPLTDSDENWVRRLRAERLAAVS